MNKLNQETVEKCYNKYGFHVISEYERNDGKLEVQEFKTGYLYYSRYMDMNNGSKPSLWGVSNYSHLEHNLTQFFQHRKVGIKYINSEIIKKSHRTRIKVTLQCECGNYYTQLLDDIVSGKHLCCHSCLVKRRGKTRRIVKQNKELIAKKGYIFIDDRESFRNDEYVEVVDSDGYLGYITCNGLKQGKNMSRFDIRVNKKHYIFNVNHYAELNGINVECLELLNDKKYTRQGLKFRCECGTEFTTSIASFQSGKFRCEKCANSISSYEFIFKKFLDDNKISYIYQYSINQCRDTLPLPFDFYLTDYDVLVEIDGEGHYTICNFNQMSHEKAEMSFNATKKHDNIKNNYCKKNNIKLIRIPYWEFKNNTFQQFFYKSLESNEL